MAGRDPDNDCEAFHEGAPGGAGADATCQTDGHYRCDECVFRASCDGGCGERPEGCECRYCDGCAERVDRCRCPQPRALSNEAFARRMRARRPSAPTIPPTIRELESWEPPTWSKKYLGEFVPQSEDAPEDTPFTRRMLTMPGAEILKPPAKSLPIGQIYTVERRRKS